MRMGATHFLMKRLPRVATEMALHVLAYNLTRILIIIGIKPMMAAVMAQSALTSPVSHRRQPNRSHRINSRMPERLSFTVGVPECCRVTLPLINCESNNPYGFPLTVSLAYDAPSGYFRYRRRGLRPFTMN